MVRYALLAWIAVAPGCDWAFGLSEVNDLPGDHDDEGAGVLPDASSVFACPATYTGTLPSSDSAYRFVATSASWIDAAATCAADAQSGSAPHLVVISNDSEREALQSQLAGRVAWVGLSDRGQDTFQWVTAEPTTFGTVGTSDWAPGEPDLGGAGCVTLSSAGRLDDDACAASNVYACECDAYPDIPGNH